MTVHVFAPPRSHGGVGAYTDDLLAHVDADVRWVRVDREWVNPLRYLRASLGTGCASASHVQYVYGMFGPKGVFTLFFLPLIFVLTHGSTIVTVHEVWQREDTSGSRIKYAYLRLVHETLARFTDQLVFLSTNAERDFLDSVPNADTRVVPHGVRTEVRDLSSKAAKESFGYAPHETVITHHGFLAHRKGADRFVDLAKAMPDYEFLLAGGSRREDLEDRLRERAPANLQITGVLGDDEFEASFAASDLAVLPYREINQSGTFNWCATYQLPVVATSIPYFERLANEYGCVALTDANDLEEIVRSLLEDDNRRRRFAERMAEYRDENSFTVVAAETEAMYDL